MPVGDDPQLCCCAQHKVAIFAPHLSCRDTCTVYSGLERLHSSKVCVLTTPPTKLAGHCTLQVTENEKVHPFQTDILGDLCSGQIAASDFPTEVAIGVYFTR